jgi:hypothetical protein
LTFMPREFLYGRAINTNPHWARVVGYGPFLCVIHKEDLCHSNGDVNRLMMMMMCYYYMKFLMHNFRYFRVRANAV